MNNQIYIVEMKDIKEWNSLWCKVNRKESVKKKEKPMYDLDDNEAKALKAHLEDKINDVYLEITTNDELIIQYAVENKELKDRMNAFKKILASMEEECSDCEDCEKS